MAFNLKNRHFLTLRDFTPKEISFLLKLSADLKTAKYAGTEVPKLEGKDIALIFEKTPRVPVSVLKLPPSTRVRGSPIWGRPEPILGTRNR